MIVFFFKWNISVVKERDGLTDPDVDGRTVLRRQVLKIAGETL
jgi:hypothetical protein